MRIRTAHPNDVAALAERLARACPMLMAPAYDADIFAAAPPAMAQSSPTLLASDSYYLAENAGRLVRCGGRAFEPPGSGKVEAGLSHLRQFATDPDMARRGIGRAIFDRCATLAARCGAVRFHAFASLNAEPFYQGLGMRRLYLIEISMGPHVKMPAVLMEGAVPAATS
ncbi:MAG TPA: GNAT family N-acetyltransferase [Sphingobium sp.]|nr:GNAT family N-acetyltransferase [Sphingobium sp.]